MSPRIEISLSTFDAELPDLLDSARVADAAGVGGLWVMDHLSGNVHANRSHVLEGLSTLATVAAATERCRVGSLVTNPALRSPVILAQTFASIATLAGDRLWLGLGAGGGAGAYGDELEWAGFVNDSANVRRQRVVEYLASIDHIWSGASGGWHGDVVDFDGSPGFLHPSPPPRTLVAGYGPKMAAVAGRLADEFNTGADVPDLVGLIDAARSARSADASELRVSTFTVFDEGWLDADDPRRVRLDEAGVDALILVVSAPFDQGLVRSIAETNQG